MKSINHHLYEFTITVPSYNRGKRALFIVESIFRHLENNWSVLILNNASMHEQEYYNKIEELSKTDNRIRYIKHEYNRQFHGNYMACFELANSKYIMITSDEDVPVVDKLHNLLKAFSIIENLGIIRTSGIGGSNMCIFDDLFFDAGDNALLGYGFTNNYISGTIYNLDMIKKFKLLDQLKANLSKHSIYPHLYLELLICTYMPVIVSSEVCINEGESQKVADNSGMGILNDSSTYKEPYSLGSRIDQFVHFRDAIIEIYNIKKSDSLFINMYLALTRKYYYLIGAINMPMYQRNLIEKQSAINCLYHVAIGLIIPIITSKELLEHTIDSIKDLHNSFVD